MKRNKLIIVAIAYFAFVNLGLFDGLLGNAWPGLRESFSLMNRDQGTLVGLGVIGYIAASLANGRLITRFGVAVLLIVSALLAAGARLGQGLAPSWFFLVAVAPVAGFGGGMLDAGMNTYAAARFRPRLINWLHASFGIGTTLGALIMTGILALNGTWRAGFTVIAALQVVLLVLLLATAGRWEIAAQAAEGLDADGQTNGFATTADTLRLPMAWLGIGFFFLYVAVEIGFAFWAFTILTESRGMVEENAGLLATLYWGSFTAGRILLGFIETRLDHLVRWALLGAVSGLALFAFNLGPVVTVGAALLLGFAQAPVFPAMIAMTPRRVGARHAPNTIGFQVAAAGVGVGVFPGLAGAIGDWVGLEAIGWFLLAVSLMLFGLHEVLRKKEKKPEFGGS